MNISLHMSLDAYGHKQTNQILDFDERHCINEYKSAYVLRCRSTNSTGEVKFFLEDVGLKHHFKIKHNNSTLDDHVRRDCKMYFHDLHGQETLKMLNQLSELRLQMVCIVILYLICVSLSLFF